MPDYYKAAGKTTVAPDVLHTIARLTTLQVEGVNRMSPAPAVRMNQIFKRSANEGVVIEVQDGTVYADLYLVLNNGVNIRDVSRNIQREVARAISEMVGMPVGRINIHVEDMEYSPESGA